VRDGHRKASRHGVARTGGEDELFGGDNIHPGGTVCSVGGEGEVGAVRQADEGDVDWDGSHRRGFSGGRGSC
jgi:hypothetical protein